MHYMNIIQNKIGQQLTGKPLLQEIGISELETITELYPYFSAPQLLLAQKLKEDQHASCRVQLQKTALHFSNIYLLHLNLTNIDYPSETEKFFQETTEEKEKINSQEFNEVIDQIKLITTEKHTIENKFKEETAFVESLDEDNFPLLDEYETDVDNDKIDTVTTNIRLAEMLQSQALAFNKPVELSDKLDIEKEPYHTIDYFDSQGIKIESLQPDQLGNKVRRFTDWLKQMKRVAPQPSDLGTDSETEQMIQEIAATSNEAKDIVTEAMAEVLIKQGKFGKAILLYQKLSFLNPNKSAYFANKIEQLKSI